MNTHGSEENKNKNKSTPEARASFLFDYFKKWKYIIKSKFLR